ncbi:MAG TPA: ATP-binding protein [Pirellulales bacterium]|jgi:two-component system phosphate regulon sensor histidine kinase PhoR|nr:ATP-binding protein [Pirellulales bacterium]
MKDSKAHTLLIAAATCALVWLADWSAGLFVSLDAARGPHYLALGFLFLLAAGAIMLWTRLLAARQQQAQRFFEMLLRADAEQLNRMASGKDPLPVLPGNPWFATAHDFCERFAQNCSKLEHAEESRAALEVRLRRGAGRQEQIESILAGLAEPVLAVNGFDELVLVNPVARSLFEIDEKADIGQPVGQVLHCAKLVELLVETRRRKAANRRSEIELIDDAGNSKWFTAACSSFAPCEGDSPGKAPNGNGKAAGAFAVLRDASELKAGQMRYAEFVSAVSHEMKSPLAGIKAYVELLADGEADDAKTREEFLNVIGAQADRLQRLIDNLLNIARIEAGMMSVSKNAISLNELLSATLDIVRPSAAAKRIELCAEFTPMYLGVLADRDLMMQVAINLLSNAIKYTPEGGRVTLRSRAADDEAQFDVDDTGVGLDEEDKLKVFERFYRVHKDRHMASGTGLGLPLAKHIVEDVHGGRLTVESSPGKGSVFTVSLPTAAQLVS